MAEENEEYQQKQYIRMRAINDYSRGAIFLLFGSFFLLFKSLHIEGIAYQSWFPYMGGLFVVYGAWRIYRGYKKAYFR